MRGKTILFIILLVLVGAAYFISTGSYSDGERAGTISKLSTRGYIFKTTEGVLNEGGYSGETGTLTPKYWEFSCKEDTVVTKLKQALDTGERVTLIYEEKFFQFPWNGDTKYFITDVKFFKHHQPAAVVPQVPTTVVQPATIDTTKK